MAKPNNEQYRLDRLIGVAAWVQAQDRVFQAREVAEAHGMSMRCAYRYLGALRRRDEHLQAEAGVGYLYRGQTQRDPLTA